jgi:hypothetical protein
MLKKLPAPGRLRSTEDKALNSEAAAAVKGFL